MTKLLAFIILLTYLTITITITITITTAATTSESRSKSGHYKTLVPGYSYKYLLRTTEDYATTASSIIECAGIALRNQSEFFTYNKDSKICQDFSPKNILTVNQVQDNNQFALYRSQPWIKAYTITLRPGVAVSASLLNEGQPSDWKVAGSSDFFRHPILDVWEKLPIDQVKLIIYKKQRPVVTMVFNGQHSTIKNWFTITRLRSSPWKDLKGRRDEFFFTIKGGMYDFEIYYKTYECPNTSGWLYIMRTKNCDWDTSSDYPNILYSDKANKTAWYKEAAGHADSLAIFFSLKHD